jgi:hypothetical protein
MTCVLCSAQPPAIQPGGCSSSKSSSVSITDKTVWNGDELVGASFDHRLVSERLVT